MSYTSNYTKKYVSSHFWDDNYIVELDPTEKLLFLYLLTNPLVKISGVYKIPLKKIAFDTGLEQDIIRKILKKFEEAGKIFYDKGYIIIPNFPKYQSYNSNIIESIQEDINYLIPILKYSIGFQRLLKNLSKIDKAFESLLEAF
ncbi:hypothetical protein JCM12298_10860 [Desulfothermus naphthae]